MRVLWHILFNIGFFTFFWGAFEFAYKVGTPIWSGTFGFPILHHYIIGAIMAYVTYLLLNLEDIVKIKQRLNRRT